MDSKEPYQGEIFLASEGDAWFLRNRDYASRYSSSPLDLDLIFKSLASFRNQINRVLEIGCSSGEKITQISEYFGATGYGIDPSKMAVKEAIEKSKLLKTDLNFDVGLASNLPYEDGLFDFVFFGFCLYLVPPSEVFMVVQEANRVLKKGGFLAILDFDYGLPRTNLYKHAADVYTYKNNYSQIFMSGGHFSLISKWSFSHADSFFTPDRDERVSIEVLYKDI